MPINIDPETMHVDDLPAVWSPVQWELTEEERIIELENQSTASLLWNVDAPEAILRLLLNETDIERAYAPPEGYAPEMQGEWDEDLVTFKFKRAIRLLAIERQRDHLYVEYQIEGIGVWALEIEPDEVSIYRV